jgi:YHS domain-containing protein
MKYALSAIILLALGTAASARAEAAKKDAYPLTTCVVSGESLGDHGDPYVMKHQGREVRFCCKDCRKDFLKDPAKYLKKIDDAEKARAADAPAT